VEYVWENEKEAEPVLLAVAFPDDGAEPSFQSTVAVSKSLGGAVQEIGNVTL
jgi:hypothetical protein